MQLQGLSPTQRSARATPSRDLTLGVVQQKEPQKTINPKVSKVHQERQNERNQGRWGAHERQYLIK